MLNEASFLSLQYSIVYLGAVHTKVGNLNRLLRPGSPSQ